jgi:hypothetical protein
MGLFAKGAEASFPTTYAPHCDEGRYYWNPLQQTLPEAPERCAYVLLLYGARCEQYFLGLAMVAA